jgi:hypothetical protein
MITIDLMGGLGNQLFQIFTCIAVSLETKQPFVFRYSTMLNERKTYWDNFLSFLKLYTHPDNPINRGNWVKFEEKGFHYSQIPQIQYYNLRLSGYFQSYKYFEEYQDKIFQKIQLREQQNQIRNEFMQHYKPITIAIHFRWGDYKHKQYYHPLLPFDYYKSAVQTLVETLVETMPHGSLTNVEFLYFCESEDNIYIEPMIQRLNALFPATYTKVDDSIEDWKQLLIMSCCHHQIIANSSYSWFSGYFNDNPSKMVCYPSIWFGPGLSHHNLADLFPPTWKKID